MKNFIVSFIYHIIIALYFIVYLAVNITFLILGSLLHSYYFLKKLIVNIFEEIVFQVDWYYNKFIGIVYYKPKYGIYNLFTWFIVIWTDRNYDYFFIYYLLKKKLKLLSKHIDKHSLHVYKNKSIKKIKICLLLIDRIIKNDYYLMVYKDHNKKWGESKFNFEDCEEKGCKKVIIDRINVITEEDKKQQMKEYKRLMKHEGMLLKQDKDYLFNLIRKHHEEWWY